MIIEHSPFGRRGFFGSFTLQGVQAGQVFAAAIFLPLAALMPADAFQSWGWRIPFLLSVVVVIAGYIIRRRVDETPAFKEEAEHGEVPKSPIVMAFRDSGGNMLAGRVHGPDERRRHHRGDLSARRSRPTRRTGSGSPPRNYLWISVAATSSP